MPGIALAIFDCDGVLVDSEPIVTRVHAGLLAECGFPIGEAELARRFCGIADAEMLAAIEREWGRPLPRFYAERVAELVEREYRRSLQPIPGVPEAVARLGLPVCVASSGTPERIRLGLKTAGLLDHFAPNLFSATMVARGKPAPDLFRHAAQQMGALPGHCVVIEDSPAGIDAAVAAGIVAIGFCGGSHCRPDHGEKLRARGAALVLSEMGELPAAVADLVARR